MNYKRAWKCHKCPQNSGENGCPCWVELFAINHATGQQEPKKSCLFQALPFLLTEVIKASNRPAAAMESMRNEIMKGLHALVMTNLQSTLEVSDTHLLSSEDLK